MAVILPSEMATSAGKVSVAVTTVPLVIRVSKAMRFPHTCLLNAVLFGSNQFFGTPSNATSNENTRVLSFRSPDHRTTQSPDLACHVESVLRDTVERNIQREHEVLSFRSPDHRITRSPDLACHSMLHSRNFHRDRLP